MVRWFPQSLDFGQSNNTFYEISAIFKNNFFLNSAVEFNWPRWIYFFYIPLLKYVNLVLIPGAKLDDN